MESTALIETPKASPRAKVVEYQPIEIPQEVRERLGLAARGPLPRALRLSGVIQRADTQLAVYLEPMLHVIYTLAAGDPDSKGDVGAHVRLAAARYLVDRVMGTPAPQEKPPAEDMSPPVDGIDPAVTQAMSFFKGMSDGSLTRIKQIILEDLKRQGKVPEDATVDTLSGPANPTQ